MIAAASGCPEPVDLFVVQAHALPLQQDADPKVTEPTSLAGDLPHRLADNNTALREFATDWLGIDADTPGTAKYHDPASPEAPYLADRSMSSVPSQQVFQDNYE